MIKLFFLTFFIAELIIASTVIFKIYRLGKCVNALNDSVCANKIKIKTAISDVRFLIEECIDFFNETKELIRRKKEEYLIKTAKNMLIYLGILMLKGKYKKTVFVYQLASEIYEGFSEFEC